MLGEASKNRKKEGQAQRKRENGGKGGGCKKKGNGKAAKLPGGGMTIEPLVPKFLQEILGKQKADKEDNSRKKKRKKKEATRGSASI